MDPKALNKISIAVHDELAKPFVHCDGDCFALLRRAIDAGSGSSLMDKYAGKYKTQQGNYRFMKKEGHGSLVEVLAFFADPLPSPAHSLAGDLAVVSDGSYHCFAVCLGTGNFVTKTENGPRYFSTSDVVAAARIRGAD